MLPKSLLSTELQVIVLSPGKLIKNPSLLLVQLVIYGLFHVE